MKMTKWLFIPALLAVAAMVFIGCPSQPDPPPDAITDPDYLLVKGIFEKEHSVAIVSGNEYEVLIDVTSKDRDDSYEIAIDYYLWGCHFQAELYYTIDGDTKKYLQANNKNSAPANISDYERKYRVTLKAGDMGTDKDQADAVKEGYTLTGGSTGNAVTAPAGATQYVRLISKTPNWYKMGVPFDQQEDNPPNVEDDTKEINYYSSTIKLGFNGSVTMQKKPVYTYDPNLVEILVTTPDASGKGNIEGTDFEKLIGLQDGSRIKMTYSVNVVLSGGGGDSCQPGWAFAEFGTSMEEHKIRGQNLNVDVVVPLDVSTAGTYNGTAYILVDDIVSASKRDGEPTWTFLNVYNGGNVTKLELEKATGLAP
jgi:hypothetical protein